MNVPRCQTCGDPLAFNPKKTDTPTGGWYHDAASYGGQSRLKSDPDYHQPNPDPMLHGPSVALGRQAAQDQAKAHVQRTLSKQFAALSGDVDLRED